MERTFAQLGEVFTMQLAALPPIVMIADPAAIKEIFTGDPDVFHAGSANVVLKPILGSSSLLLLDGERHLEERKLMLPSFHGERMQAYGAVMDEAADRAIDGWPEGRPFPIHLEMQEITLDVILRTVFGLRDGEAKGELRRELVEMLAFGERPSLLLLVGPDGRLRFEGLHARLGKYSPWHELERTIRSVDGHLRRAIEARRAAAEGGDDVLAMLLAARDEAGRSLSDDALVDEMKTLLVAGHETTATALTWTVLELLAHPEVLAKLRLEIAEGREEYLEAVAKESLRLHPIVPLVGRRLQAEATVGGRTYPKGTVLAPSIYLTHRNPRIWEDPSAFVPERFIGKKTSPYEFIPFGGGVRRCLGMAFALFEMKHVLRRVVMRTHLTLAPGYTPKLVRRGITFAVDRGLPAVMRSRLARG